MVCAWFLGSHQGCGGLAAAIRFCDGRRGEREWCGLGPGHGLERGRSRGAWNCYGGAATAGNKVDRTRARARDTADCSESAAIANAVHSSTRAELVIRPDQPAAMHKMHGATLKPEAGSRELPSIKDLFPTLEGSSMAPRSQSMAEGVYVAPPVGYGPADFSLERELGKLTKISMEIQQILESSKSIAHVPRELLESGAQQADLLHSIYHSWMRTRDEEAARALPAQHPHSRSSSMQYTFQPTVPVGSGGAPMPLLLNPSRYQNMEEQAARTLSSMIEVSPSQAHCRTPSFPTDDRLTTPPVSPSSFSIRKLKMKKSPTGSNNVTAQLVLEANVDNGNLAEMVTNECLHCQSKETPEWRRGPEGERTLCNACGLFYAKLCKKYGEEKAKDIMKERKIKGSETDRRVSVGF
ncbi:hypothetical protein KL941_000287 [Ogataea angusta]|nr:hypothetical protein KL941_000287 [Ogataea angusta]